MTMRPLLNALLYFPSRTVVGTPADAGIVTLAGARLAEEIAAWADEL